MVLYEGPIWQAKILQAQLDGYGIPNFVPEVELERPFGGFAGSGQHNSCVLVPPECEDEARALLRYSPDKVVEDEPN